MPSPGSAIVEGVSLGSTMSADLLNALPNGESVSAVLETTQPEMISTRISSGGLGKEVNPLLRVISAPGSEYVLPVVLTSRIHGVAGAVGRFLGKFGLRGDPLLGEIWSSYTRLTDARTTRDFIADLDARFSSTGPERKGVHLLTLHGAKGLEFEAVFIPRLEERELPIKLAKKPEEIAEERRLFYVGMTRAKRQLAITWSGKPSRFLAELGVEIRAARPAEPDDLLYAALKRWRLQRATADDLPAYVVFHNSTLAEIAGRRPRDLSELGVVPGVGTTKLERYGSDVLRVVAECREEQVEQQPRVAADAAA